MSEKVEMRPAYHWTCPECFRDWFVEATVPELTDDELAELRDEHGIEPFDTGRFVTYPSKVYCETCQRGFETVPYSEGPGPE